MREKQLRHPENHFILISDQCKFSFIQSALSFLWNFEVFSVCAPSEQSHLSLASLRCTMNQVLPAERSGSEWTENQLRARRGQVWWLGGGPPPPFSWNILFFSRATCIVVWQTAVFFSLSVPSAMRPFTEQDRAIVIYHLYVTQPVKTISESVTQQNNFLLFWKLWFLARRVKRELE